jgi:hypothetical protein
MLSFIGEHGDDRPGDDKTISTEYLKNYTLLADLKLVHRYPRSFAITFSFNHFTPLA